MVKDKNIYAAIALALHEYKGNNVHDKESGIITIKQKCTIHKNLLESECNFLATIKRNHSKNERI